MLEAGDASLDVGDLDAAIGFYQRAAELRPNDARIKLGLARVYLRSGRPVEAIPLLNEAETAGGSQSDIMGARALAYDLVGDQSAAQASYSRAIALAPQDDELRRRYAISQAISGDTGGFNTTLEPLITGRDIAAFRARAFGLAILGEQERAEGIVNSVMPPDLSARINPYLAYMPRLTPAQQAAAANLGIFPKAADIGREDPRIARFAREGASGDRLEPSGTPLGSPEAEQNLASKPVPTQSTPTQPNPSLASNTTPTPEPVAPALASEAIEPLDAVAVTSEPVEQAVTPSVADAFSGFDIADVSKTGAQQGAVNISEIDIPREVAPQPEPEQAEPKHPRRHWVQLATGRDVEALGFDWRRLARKAGDLLEPYDPHVTAWGRANRLLAGPVANASAARQLVNRLGDKGIDSFTYTSPQGTEIKELK